MRHGRLVTAAVGPKLAVGAVAVLALAVPVVAFARMRQDSSAGPDPESAPPPRRDSMFRRALGKSVFIGLSLMAVALLVAAGWVIYDRVAPRTVTVAAGIPRDEGYALMQALSRVAEREGGNITLALRQTSGTAESLRLLEQGHVQLAVAESWMAPGPYARNLASLFHEAFFLIAQKDAKIAQLPDLKGARIALPKGGPEYQSFLSIAGHYGMKEDDFAFVGGDEETANRAFLKHDTAARFVLGPVNKPEIVELLANGSVVDLDPSVSANRPTMVPMTLAKGAYSANPAAPPGDVHTLSSQRLLFARADLDDWLVERILGLLSDRRYEVAAAMPPSAAATRALVGQISAPVLDQAVTAPVHPGAAAFFSPRPPSLVIQNADIFTLAGALLIVAVLWVAEFRRLSRQESKARADRYRGKILKLMREAQSSGDPKAVGAIPGELLAILADAVEDLEGHVHSDHSFQSFSSVWDVAYRFARERRAALDSKGAGPADPSDTGDPGVTNPSHKMSLSRLLATARSK